MCRHGRGFYIGQVSSSHFLLRGPRLSLNHKKHMLAFGWLARRLNGQQLGFRSRSDGGASLSCTIETDPSIDQITSTKVCYTLLRPSLLPSTYRNLAVHLRSSSSSYPASFLLPSLRPSLSISTYSCNRPLRPSCNRLRVYWVVMGKRGRFFDFYSDSYIAEIFR